MSNVYLVSRRMFRKSYEAEPFETERVVKVFDDYHKAVVYICESIKNDHKEIDAYGNRDFHKYVPNPDRFEEGIFITCYDYATDTYYEKMSYRFKSYEVE